MGGAPFTARMNRFFVSPPRCALALALVACATFFAALSKAESSENFDALDQLLLGNDTRADETMSPESQPAVPSDMSPRERSRHRLAYELRGNVVGVLSAPKSYEASGTCATGTGTAPVAIYGQRGEARVFGSGIGLGLRGGYMYMPPSDPSARFPVWALRAGGGLDITYLYAQMPTGMDEASGELCATVQKRTPRVNTESGSMLLLQFPLQFGAHIGIGRFHDGERFRGVLVGAAFSPSLTHIEPVAGPRSTELRWFGTEVTVDFVDLEKRPEAPTHPASLRISAFLSPPSRKLEPLIVTLGVGAAWY